MEEQMDWKWFDGLGGFADAEASVGSQQIVRV